MTSIISEYEVSVFRDVEAAVTLPNILCNSGYHIGDLVVEHNQTEEIIAWFLEGICASCFIAHYMLSLWHQCSKRLVMIVDS